MDAHSPHSRSSRPELSVCVLAYRAADTIGRFVEELVDSLERDGVAWEIVLVGNYFPDTGDRTPEVVAAISQTDSRILHVARPKQGMMGWDMRSGLEAATGDAIAVIDGDGQMPADDAVRVYRHLVDGRFDLAKTYRAEREDGAYRRLVSRVYNLAFRALFPGLRCRDMNAKPKALTRASYERMDLRSDGWFIDAEIMIQARRLGLRIGEVPTRFRRLEGRPSFVRPSAILEFAYELIRARLLEFGLRSTANRSSGPGGE